MKRISKKELEEEIKSLKEKFGLTDEEIQGYLNFFNIKPASRRMLNSGSKND